MDAGRVKETKGRLLSLIEDLSGTDPSRYGEELWREASPLTWRGDVPLVDPQGLPENRPFLLLNEEVPYLGLRRGERVRYISLATVDPLTRQRGGELLLPQDRAGVFLEYIPWQERGRWKSLERSHPDARGGKRQTLLRSPQGDPLILLTLEEATGGFPLSRGRERGELVFHLFWFSLIPLLLSLPSVKRGLGILFLLRVLSLPLFCSSWTEALLPLDFLRAGSWLVLCLLAIRYLLPKVFLLPFFFWTLLISYRCLDSLIPRIETTLQLWPFWLLQLPFLIALFCPQDKPLTRRGRLIFLGLVLLFHSYSSWSLMTKARDNLLAEAIVRMDREGEAPTIRLREKLSALPEDWFSRGGKRELSHFLETFFPAGGEGLFPSAALYKDGRMVEYASPNLPASALGVLLPLFDSTRWREEKSLRYVGGFPVELQLFGRSFLDPSGEKLILLVFFSRQEPNPFSGSPSNSTLTAKGVAFFPLSGGEGVKVISRNGTQGLVRRGGESYRGRFVSQGSRPSFLGYRRQTLVNLGANLLRVSGPLLLVYFLLLILFRGHRFLNSLFARFSALLFGSSFLLVLVLQLSLGGFWERWRGRERVQRFQEEGEILRKNFLLLQSSGSSPQEAAFAVHRLSGRAIVLYEGLRASFFLGHPNPWRPVLPLEAFRVGRSGQESFLSLSTGGEALFFFPDSSQNRYVALLFPSRGDEDVDGFSDPFLVYTLLLALLATWIGGAINARWRRGFSRVTTALGSLEEGQYPILPEGGVEETREFVSRYNHLVGQLKEQRGKIEELTEKEALLKLARKAAHEIKNPLTPIKLNIEHLASLKKRGSEDFPELFDELIPLTLKEIAKLEGVVRDFLNFSRQEPLIKERVSLAAFARKLQLLFQGYHIDFQVDVPQDAVLWSSESPLETVFKNLVLNALEAMKEDRRLVLTAKPDGGFWELCLRDYGEGVREQDKEKIFLSGFSTKKGSGLGLSIVREIVQRLNGEIRVLSWEDKGTLVILRFPAAPESRGGGEA